MEVSLRVVSCIRELTYIVHASTVTKVQKEITELKYKLEHGCFVGREKVILDEWFKVWLEEYKKNRVKIGTYTSYEKYYRFCIHERMGEMSLTDIRGVDVQKFYNDLVKDGYALSSIKVASAVLNGCLRQAMRNGLIEQNPSDWQSCQDRKEKKIKNRQ